jgi:mannitol/fructose-specific phosphotransferase system IIA component (Ntr-type)
MKIERPSYVDLNLNSTSKKEAISLLVDHLWNEGKLSQKYPYLEAVLQREELLSTYCGYAIAIPHAESSAVNEASFVFGRTSAMVWDEEDEPVEFIILLAIPSVEEGKENKHIEIMSNVATIALEEDVRKKWANATTIEEIINTFN